jgi:hypothetical protein
MITGGAGSWPLRSGVEPRYFVLKPAMKSVTVVTQAIVNLACKVRMQYPRSTQLPLTLRTHADSQVARSRAAVLHFSGCGQAEAFLRRLVSLHFWHF